MGVALSHRVPLQFDHIFAKNWKYRDSNIFAFRDYCGRGHRFRIALEISSSMAISSWVFNQIRQHHIFQLHTLGIYSSYFISLLHIYAHAQSLSYSHLCKFGASLSEPRIHEEQEAVLYVYMYVYLSV